MAKRKLRVGFDLDGVLLYNPARVARRLVVYAKHNFLKTKETKFFIPQTPFQQWLWRVFHYSSLFVAPGFDEVKQLAKKGKIEAYIITGRYGFLEEDFEKWLQKLDAKAYFEKAILNTHNEQPYRFKERTVQDLDLDIFVEDNWDIVRNLNSTKTKIFWIYNILDRNIEYKYKFPTLEKAIQYIKKNLV